MDVVREEEAEGLKSGLKFIIMTWKKEKLLYKAA